MGSVAICDVVVYIYRFCNSQYMSLVGAIDVRGYGLVLYCVVVIDTTKVVCFRVPVSVFFFWRLVQL